MSASCQLAGSRVFSQFIGLPSVLVLVVILVAGVGYAWSWRSTARADRPKVGAAIAFVVGLAVAAAATVGPVATYAAALFWVRALQVLLLLYVAPFFLALGRPVTLAGAAADRLLGSRSSRMLCSPVTTSIAMMAAPWLLYKTSWYRTSMSGFAAQLTGIMLLLIGFGYYYARLQVDRVPRRYSPLLSIAISVAEGLADGVLGVVLWLGPLIAVDYYSSLNRDWGPSMRVDQSIGAGILWIGGDLFGLVFVAVLMRLLGQHERGRAAQTDAALDQQAAAPSALWWKNDPQLRERFDRG